LDIEKDINNLTIRDEQTGKKRFDIYAYFIYYNKHKC